MELDVVLGRGHPNVTARHRGTIEITRDPYVTRRGDCVVVCCADKAGPELSRELVDALVSRVRIAAVFEAGGLTECVVGVGPGRAPTSPHRLVIRRSGFVDDSTLMVFADKAAADLDRRLIARIRQGVVVAVRLLLVKD